MILIIIRENKLILMYFNYRLRFLPTLAVLFFLCTACKPNNTATIKRDHLAKPQCISDQSDCLRITKVGNFSLLFDVKTIKTEVPFSLYIQYQGKLQLQSIAAYMEGKNMFMGKIPLFFKPAALTLNNSQNTANNKSRTFSAETMVVACSEPDMQWRVWVTAKLFDKNRQKTVSQQFFIDFNSRYN